MGGACKHAPYLAWPSMDGGGHGGCMAFLVGIDEAGYGPHLGPLVVAAATLEFSALARPAAGGTADALPDPDLWESLQSHIHKRPSGSGGRVVVCDSKVAYASGNLATLERAVLGFLAAAGARPRSLAELIRVLAVPSSEPSANGLPRPWDRPEALCLPLASDTAEIDSAAAHLEKGLAVIGGRIGGLTVNIASAARLNRLIDGDRNKAGALFALAADLVAESISRSRGQAVHFTMDRHGGRRYYAGLLCGAFPMTAVETLEESPEMSRYRLVHSGSEAPVLISVCDRCETWSLPTALASMAAKYVRELAMAQLNASVQSLVPGLRPTAGYGLDAWRFLDDVAGARTAAGVPVAAMLRSR